MKRDISGHHVISLFLILTALYGAACVFMYVVQDDIVFHPEAGVTDAAAYDIPRSDTVDIKTADGERLIGWYVKRAGPEKKIFLYFHGNAGNLTDRAEKFKALTATGHGLMAISYRGYGESSGAPSEQGLRLDAIAAWGYIRDKHISEDDIIIYGESLGTGVALGVIDTYNLKPHMLALEAPFTSILQRGKELYPWLPVGLLLRNKFDSINHAANTTVPSLVIHGREDDIVPIQHGHAIYGALGGDTKAFRQCENTGHSDFNADDLLRIVEEFREDKHLVNAPPVIGKL